MKIFFLILTLFFLGCDDNCYCARQKCVETTYMQQVGSVWIPMKGERCHCVVRICKPKPELPGEKE